MQRTLTVLLALLLAINLTSCGPGRTEFETADEDEVAQLAKEIEKSIAKMDPSVFDSRLDLKELEERAMEGLDISSKDRQDISRGLEEKMKMGSQVVASVTGENDGYQFLRTRVKDGKPHALFILNSQMGGINYHDLLIGKDPSSGELKILDIYIYASGEYLSTTLKDLIGLMLKQLEGSTSGIEKMTDFQMAAQGGRPFETVERRYQDLPEELKQNKAIMLLRTISAADASEETYNKILREFEGSFPNDPALDLMMLDKTYLEEDYEAMMKHVNDLTEALGGTDHQLLSMKAVALLGLEKYDESIKAAKESLEMGENYASHTCLFMAYFLNKNWEEAVKEYDYLINTAGDSPANWRIEGFEEFENSEAYQAWQAQ